MGAIAPIDFGDPNITLPFEGCKSDKFTSKIKTSYSIFRAGSSNNFEIAAFLKGSDWL